MCSLGPQELVAGPNSFRSSSKVAYQAGDVQEAPGTPHGATALHITPPSSVSRLLVTPISGLRELDLKIEREQRAQDTHFEAVERRHWEAEANSLEEAIAARRQTLANARGLVHDRTQLVREEATQIKNQHEAEHKALLASAQQEASYWQDQVGRIAASVQQLEHVVSKEAIRTERLRGCALVRRSRCLDLEKSLEQHRYQSQKLSGELDSLEQRLPCSRREGEQELSVSRIRQEELERNLLAVRRTAAESETRCQKHCLETTARHEMEIKQLKRQYHGGTAAIIANIESLKTESAESGAMPARASASGRKSRSPRFDLGVRAASMRSFNHRQEVEGRNELTVLQAELFRTRQELEADKPLPGFSHNDLEGQLHVARSQLEVAEGTYRRIVRREVEQEAHLRECEVQLEEHQVDVQRCLAALGMPKMLMRHPPSFRTVWPSSHQVTQVRDAAMKLKVRTRRTMSHLWEEHAAEIVEMRQAEAEILQHMLSDVKVRHRQEHSSFTEEHEVAVQCWHVELEEESLCQRTGFSRRASDKLRKELGARLHRLAEVQQRCLNNEAVTQHHILQSAMDEAENGEYAYVRLREALVEACAEAERQHAEALEEQAMKVREFSALSRGRLPIVYDKPPADAVGASWL